MIYGRLASVPFTITTLTRFHTSTRFERKDGSRSWISHKARTIPAHVQVRQRRGCRETDPRRHWFSGCLRIWRVVGLPKHTGGSHSAVITKRVFFTLHPTQLSQNEQYRGHYRLLQLFAYGTFGDYLSGSNLQTSTFRSKPLMQGRR